MDEGARGPTRRVGGLMVDIGAQADRISKKILRLRRELECVLIE
jgi:hypothetical protein